jgi:hypothetical protein
MRSVPEAVRGRVNQFASLWVTESFSVPCRESRVSQNWETLRQAQGKLLRQAQGRLWGTRSPGDCLAAEVHSGNLAHNLHTRECFCTGPDSKAVLYQRHTIGMRNACFILYLAEKGGSL